MLRLTRRAWFLALLVVAVPAGAVTLTFETDALAAEEVTAGGQVLFFGVESVPIPGGSEIRLHREVVADTDNDHRVSYRPDEAPSWSSVWWVVDLSSGEAVAGAPAEFGVRQIDEGTSPALTLAPAPAATLAAPLRTHLELALVRPGATPGLWALSTTDGGRGDVQAVADGELAVDLLSLPPVGSTAGALSALAAGDLLLLIDSQRLEVGSLLAAGR